MPLKNYFVSKEELALQDEYIQRCSILLKQLYPNRPPLCYLHSYGCQGNVAEGERLKRMISQMGYSFCEETSEADFILFNTCAVRENAQDRVLGNLGVVIHQKKQNKQKIIALCGCMIQQEHVVQKIQESYPKVNLVFGTHVLHKFPALLCQVLEGKKHVCDITDSQGIIAEEIRPIHSSSFKASVPIIYGCNNFCTYCIVPYVKGRERSRRKEDILSEIRELIERGYKEILLLGQNVNSYGAGLDENVNFPLLLREINAIEGDFRIRFMTSHPKDATKDLIDAIAQCDKVCNHIHLPVQCGSNRVLEKMNRKYTVEQYLHLVSYIQNSIPDASITSDIIVGFPGETREDFEQTLSLIKQVGYSSLFTFIYSKRVGTKAAAMEDPVPLSEKTKWLQELIQVQNGISESFHKKYVNQVVRVLADGMGKAEPGMLTGRTQTNLVVDFKGEPSMLGQFVDVKILHSTRMALIGECVKGEE